MGECYVFTDVSYSVHNWGVSGLRGMGGCLVGGGVWSGSPIIHHLSGGSPIFSKMGDPHPLPLIQEYGKCAVATHPTVVHTCLN